MHSPSKAWRTPYITYIGYGAHKLRMSESMSNPSGSEVCALSVFHKQKTSTCTSLHTQATGPLTGPFQLCRQWREAETYHCRIRSSGAESRSCWCNWIRSWVNTNKPKWSNQQMSGRCKCCVQCCWFLWHTENRVFCTWLRRHITMTRSIQSSSSLVLCHSCVTTEKKCHANHSKLTRAPHCCIHTVASRFLCQFQNHWPNAYCCSSWRKATKLVGSWRSTREWGDCLVGPEMDCLCLWRPQHLQMVQRTSFSV